MREPLTKDLRSILGDDCFVALTEAFGGGRLHVPRAIDADHAIAKAIGVEAAQKLSRRYAPAELRVPIARRFRALHYRAKGLTNAAIARKLVMTETGVDRIFAESDDVPVKGSAQLTLFDK